MEEMNPISETKSSPEICLSIVLPAYNEEEMLPKTAAAVSDVMQEEGIDCEILFVDDGSTDATWSRIEEAAATFGSVRGIRFSRNFGKEAAICAGLGAAKGKCVAVMDCDLQHPLPTLVEMYRLWEQGYEVVEGVKRSRGRESLFHAAGAKAFYRMMSGATGIDMSRASDFKLLDRRAVDALLQLPERQGFFRAQSAWIGFRSVQVEFDVQEREAGSSKWSVLSLGKYAIANFVDYSSLPIKLLGAAGVIVFLFALVLGIQTLVRYFSGNSVEGFTTVIILILFLGSCIMMSISITGYYIVRIYEEVKRRPRYIISRMI